MYKKVHVFVLVSLLFLGLGMQVQAKDLPKVLPSLTDWVHVPPLGMQIKNPEQYLPKVYSVANTVLSNIKIGKMWEIKGPLQEHTIKVVLLYQNRAICAIEVDPATGKILPVGYRPQNLSDTQIKVADELRSKLKEEVKHLKISPSAEYMMPEAAWCVPITYKNMKVGKIKITYNGVYVIPDYPLEQEMNFVP